MSDFTSEGFVPFPNTYEDNKHVADFSLLTDLALERKVHEYWAFAARDDIMPRARTTAARILSHLGQEVDWRAGVFEPQTMQKLEEEIHECA